MTTPVPNIPAALVQAGMDVLISDGHALDTNLPAGACDCPECRERVVRAVLGAVFAACEVREHWSVRTAAEALVGAERLGEHLRHAGVRLGSPAADQDLPAATPTAGSYWESPKLTKEMMRDIIDLRIARHTGDHDRATTLAEHIAARIRAQGCAEDQVDGYLAVFAAEVGG